MKAEITKAGFAIAEVTPGKLNALVKNIMTQTGAKDPNEAVRLVNSGEWVVKKYSSSWREEDGVIYFLVTSDGTTGKEWVERWYHYGLCLGNLTKEVLLSSDFKPTNGVTTEIVVLPSSILTDYDRKTKNIRAWAENFRTTHKHRLSKPNAELACLISEKFSEKEFEAMGLRCIIPMHEPISDSCGSPRLLGKYYRSLSVGAYDGRPDSKWEHGDGFAFEVSQTKS